MMFSFYSLIAKYGVWFDCVVAEKGGYVDGEWGDCFLAGTKTLPTWRHVQHAGPQLVSTGTAAGALEKLYRPVQRK